MKRDWPADGCEPYVPRYPAARPWTTETWDGLDALPTERIADDNGDELEHGQPDFPGQFPDTEGPCGQCGGGDGLGHTPDCPAVAGDRSDMGDAQRALKPC